MAVCDEKSHEQDGGIGNAMSFGKSNAKVYVKAQTGKTFKDVAGQDEAKDALREIVDFLHNPQKYTEIGASMPKGALLVGPPRNRENTAGAGGCRRGRGSLLLHFRFGIC